MSDSAKTDNSRLTGDEASSLRCIARTMIPADAQYHVPGADDDTIFADVLHSMDDRDEPAVKLALKRLGAIGGTPLEQLPPERQAAAIARFRDEFPILTAALVNVIVRCYYRDDRVMRSINMEPRPPFPKGFEVEQGDWSLLEPVRARGKIYRDAP